MREEVYIRPLREADAEISWQWRNDSEVWRYTGGRPDRIITPQIEHDWIQRALTDATCKRFAICLSEKDQYIGNVQLSGIDTNAGAAEFHIFIGERSVWGRGYGTFATQLMLKYAKETLQLRTIFLFVNEANTAAVRVYRKLGFVFLEEFEQKSNGRLRKMWLDFQNEITYQIDSCTTDGIKSYLALCEDLMVPPGLSQRLDIVQFAEKLRRFGTTFEAYRDNRLIGLIAAYINDTVHRHAYILFVCVLPEVQGCGVAQELMRIAFEQTRRQKFVSMCLEVSRQNMRAIRFYQNIGFNRISETEEKYLMEKKW